MKTSVQRASSSGGRRSAARCLLLAALALASLHAQPPLHGAEEEREDALLKAVTPEGRGFTLDCETMRSFVDGDYRVLVLHGYVHIFYEDTHIHADSVVLWYDYTQSNRMLRLLRSDDFKYGYGFIRSKERAASEADQTLFERAISGAAEDQNLPPWMTEPVELYAEGHVRITRAEGTMYCDQLYTNMAEDRGIILSGRIFSYRDFRDRTHPLHFKAAVLKQVYQKLYTMEEAHVTTCVCGVPHYALKVDRAELRGDEEGGILSTEGTSFGVRGVPLPLPDSSFRVGRSWYFPVKRVNVGSSSRYGTYLEITLEEDFDKLGKAAHSALGVDRPFKGNIELELDFYKKRGVGFGPMIEYESKDFYKGYAKAYSINDSEDVDRGGRPIEQNKRGRIRTQNRVDLGEGNLLDLELSYISDPGFLDEYFESEYKTDKEQETYVYFHKAEGSQAYSILGRWRLNDFQTQNEYLPQALWDLSSIPVLRAGTLPPLDGVAEPLGVFYNQRTEFSNVRNRPEDDSTDESERITRGDYVGTFEAPFRSGILKVTPFYENRLSFFERTLDNSKPVGRVVQAYGARAGTLFHAESDYTNEFLNIHRLRNIVEPSVIYRDTYAISRDREELIFYDEMETPQRGNAVSAVLRHRLQTRNPEKDNQAHTLYDGVFLLPFYPDRRLSENDDHRMGLLRFDTTARPLFQNRFLQKLSINEEGRFNVTEKRFEQLNSRLSMMPDDDFNLVLYHRWVRGNYSYLGFLVRYLLSAKWEAEVELRYNIERHEWSERVFTFRRRAHQWLFEVSMDWDDGDDNKSFGVSVTPLALFSKKRHKGSIYDPMLGE